MTSKQNSENGWVRIKESKSPEMKSAGFPDSIRPHDHEQNRKMD